MHATAATIFNLLSVFGFLVLLSQAVDPWDLPVFPVSPFPQQPTHTKFARNSTNQPQPVSSEGSYLKKIPRLLWIAVKDAKDKTPEGLSYQMLPLFNRNPLWDVHIAGTWIAVFGHLQPRL